MTDQVQQVIVVHDDVQTAHLSQTELLGIHAGEAHGLPCGDGVGLARGVHSLLVETQLHQAQSQLGVVVDVVEEDAAGFVELFSDAQVTNLLEFGNGGARDELLKISKPVVHRPV